MVELIINGISAVLSDNFSFRYVRENPKLTQTSDYTYDISLPLNDPTNVQIFGIISPQWVTKPEFKYPASIKVNGSTLISGIVVPLDWSDNEVKVQLLAGNAEFNYTVKDDLYITDLDLPVVPNPQYDIEYGQYNGFEIFPVVNYVFAPILNTSTNQNSNPFIRKASYLYGTNPIFTSYLPVSAPKAVQPYLCSMIREIFKAIGYEVIKNIIEETEYKRLFICNSSITMRYVDVLPKWTVKEFFDEISTLFQVEFQIIGNEVSIVPKVKDYSASPIELVSVIDEYESKVNEDESPGNNIEYDFASDEVEIIDDLPEDITDLFGEKFFETYPEMRDWYIGDGKDAEKTIMRLNDKTYIEWDGTIEQVDKWGRLYLGFKNTKKIRLIPAQTYQNVTIKTVSHHPGGNYVWGKTEVNMLALPGSPIKEQNVTSEQTYTVQNFIQDNIVEKYYPEKLHLTLFESFDVYYYPKFSVINNYCDLRLQVYEKSIGKLFHTNYVKYSTTEHSIKFVYRPVNWNDRSLLSVDRPYLINGKKYVCKRIEVDISHEGISEEVQGIFYEIKQ